MRVAIIDGGFTGLTAGYELTKSGHEVTIFEKEPFLGGLASGFKGKGWDWPLEKPTTISSRMTTQFLV